MRWLGLLVLLSCASRLCADPGQAAAKVEEGVRRFRAGAYDAAVQAFTEADAALPDDARIAFDRACAAAAKGDFDKAVEFLQKGALARDPATALLARFDLGDVAMKQAQAAVGERPEDAAPDARKKTLDFLATAVNHFRDCIRQGGDAPVVADARHNLELIRLWTKHMQALWEEKDRQRQRQEMDLLQFLEMIRTRQRALRLATRALAPAAESPQRREAIAATEKAQRALADEIAPLEKKIAESLAAPPAAPNAAPHGQGNEQAVAALTKEAEAARAAMGKAADELAAGKPSEAVPPQSQVIESLDRIFLAVVPYSDLVQKGLQAQQDLVAFTAPLAEAKTAPAESGWEDPTEDQGRLGRWAKVLGMKARQGLEQIGAMDPAKLAPPPNGNPPDPNAPKPEDVKKQIEGLKASMQKAVELTPKIETLSEEAAKSLGERKPGEALPKEEEALKLWKEIAEPLPKQDQKQDQKKEDQQKQDQQKQDQQKQDQQKQDQQKQDQQKQDQQKQDQQPPDPKQMSKEQAEALMRKVRERDRKHREDEKKLEATILEPVKVDKDW